MKSSFWEFPKIESYSRIKVQNQTRCVIEQFLPIVRFKPSQHRLEFATEEAAWIQAAGDGTAGRPSAENWLKWRILSRTSSEESGKNEKKKSYWASSTPWGHVLSLKTFCQNPVLSWAIRYIVSSLCAMICFQLFDIWWSSLDTINDFKAISRIVFFCFGEINK